MSSSRVLARCASAALRSDVCAFCRARPSLPVGRNAAAAQPVASRVYRRGYAQKLDVKRLRADVDKRSRLGWYRMTRDQKILLVQPDVAEAIYNDFAAHKEGKEYGKLVRQLVSSRRQLESGNVASPTDRMQNTTPRLNPSRGWR